MLSRVADSVYWMSRYMERAENMARFIKVNLMLSLDMPTETSQQWYPLVQATGDEPLYKKRYEAGNRQDVIRFLTFDREYPSSIFSCLTRARENARSIREIISSEMWEHINRFYLTVKDAAESGEALEEPHDFFEGVQYAGQHFGGVTDTTLSHGEPWHFARLGRLMERADKTSRILDVKYFILLPNVREIGSPFDDIQWAALLRSASGLEMYRQRHGALSPANVVEFMVLDRQFPRAVLFCLAHADESLHAISGSPTGSYINRVEQQLGRLRSDLAYANANEIISQGLHEFLDGLQIRMNDISETIAETFFRFGPSPGEPQPAQDQQQEVTQE